MKKILVMGLSGTGKTTFAGELKKYLENNDIQKNISVAWFNADLIREQYNDWDFSREGRIRQGVRMNEHALSCSQDYVICDFIAPLPEVRNILKPDWVIWMNTIQKSQYEDTNQMFIAPDPYHLCTPDHYHFCITEKDATRWATSVGQHILSQK